MISYLRWNQIIGSFAFLIDYSSRGFTPLHLSAAQPIRYAKSMIPLILKLMGSIIFIKFFKDRLTLETYWLDLFGFWFAKLQEAERSVVWGLSLKFREKFARWLLLVLDCLLIFLLLDSLVYSEVEMFWAVTATQERRTWVLWFQLINKTR